jgi:hypothetical protein
MMQKWKDNDETELAAQFLKVWGTSKATLIEANLESPLATGIPITNNGVESVNGHQKANHHFHFMRQKLTTALPKLGLWLSGTSADDLNFGLSWSANVWSGEFMNKVRLELEHTPTVFDLARNWRNGGFRVMPTRKTVEELMANPWNVAETRQALNTALYGGGNSWAATWVTHCFDTSTNGDGVSKAELKIKAKRWDYDELVVQMSAFVALVPMDATTEAYKYFLKRLEHGNGSRKVGASACAPTANGFALDRAKAMSDPFARCMCQDYLHYGLCGHIIGDGLKRGLILKYPPGIDPTPILKPGVDVETYAARRGGAYGTI